MTGLRRSGFWLLAALPWLVAPVWGQTHQAPPPPGSSTDSDLQLTRQQAIDAALAQNPGLIASREQVEEARAQVVIAAALADPTIAADVAGQNHALNPNSGNGSDIGVGVTIPFPGKTGLRRAVAVSALHAAELTLTQLQEQVASQAVQAYDAILVAQRHREDLQQSKDLSDDFLKKTQARFLGGTVARLDVLKAEVDVAQAENALIANERATATARATLNRLLGRMGGASLEVTDTLEVPLPLAAIEDLESLAESSRPEVKSLAVQIEGASVATKLARQFWLPDVDVSLTRNAVDGTPTTWTTLVGFGFPLFFWQHQRGDVAVAHHRELELSANAVDIRAQVSLDVQSAYAGASTSLRQAIFIRDKLLPEAKEVYHVASVSYGLGGSSALDLLDAKRTLLDAESQFVDALGAANDAEAALELAVGAPLPLATVKSGDPQ